MKMLSMYRPTVPTTLVREDVPVNDPPVIAKVAPRRAPPRLPRDACITFTTNPTELYVSMTIRKPEHLEALIEALQMYAPQIEIGRRREQED